ncbi:TetR/AcrR family transcriptional regulator [Cnuibacter physcomitrellae]|uniref:TetR/AcrR family transcriptional regulator n=1 Tax=Cnuibacter physcomitrellae TaxID=1619308 RepID=UPI0021758835|nr:TetR/AcrR family transcriptional regulator [Cnuibacter physcomitrellae]MCS5496090.1 TetR/AcrR family transcriptional regulator [Cnuibacter physcomitrellae]
MVDTASTEAPLGPRARARVETLDRIRTIALRQLGEVGAAGLSLRAIARELGVVSSAVYRYCPSRDALLTMLIIDAYTDLGTSVETAEADVPRDDLRGRLRSVVLTVRAWALANPQRYSLIYGTPVPGYAAPPDTIAPASMVGLVLTRLLVDVIAAGYGPPATAGSAAATHAMEGVAAALGAPELAEQLVVGVDMWLHLFGAVSFELGGQFVNVVSDAPAYYEFLIDEFATRMRVP